MSRESKISNEPFWWALFGAGGVVSAMVIPVLLVLTGLAIPLGWVPAPTFETMHALLSSIWTRMILFGVITLCFFHWAHRFRFTLYDGLQLKHLESLIVVLTYGVAVAGTILTAVVLLTY